MANLFTNPPIKTIPGSPFITATSFAVSSLGPWEFGGALWGAGYVPGTSKGSVIKSTDGGLTWAQINQVAAPLLVSQGVLDIVFDPVGGFIHFLGYTAHMIYAAFDLNAGTWGAPVDSGLVAGFFKFAQKSNGDLVVVYYESDALAAQRLVYLILSGGVFGAPAQLLAGVAATSWVPCSLLVDGIDTVHAIVQTSNSGTPAVQALYHASVTTGAVTAGPTLIDGPPPIQPFNHVQSEIGVGAILGTSLLWAWVKITGLVAPFTYTITVYRGTPLAAPVWTVHSGPVYVGSFQTYSASATFRAHIVLNNGTAYVFWFQQAGDDSLRQMQYCTFDGTTFGPALVAWDALTDPAAGDPIAGASIDAFSVRPKDATFRALVDEFVTAGYDQTLVLLQNTDQQWSISAGALPDGLTINPDTGCVTGTPTTVGVFTFTVQVTNSGSVTCDSPPDGSVGIAYAHCFPAPAGSDTVTVECSITINLGFICDNPPIGIVGTFYDHAFPVMGGVPPYSFAIVGGSLPPGLTLDSNTGDVSGVPTLNGTFPFVIQVTDSDDPANIASINCSITIRKRCLLVEVG